MNKPVIRVLSNLARAGGTLVSKCLGAMEGVVLLSEIHPFDRRFYNPLQQARDWYQLLEPAELEGRRFEFNEAIGLIQRRCRERGRTLVVRDWAHIDFIGVPFVARPPMRSQLTVLLERDFRVLQHALTRHPVDQWFSTSRLDIMRGRLELDAFLAGYRQYAEHCLATGFTRYEDFTRAPQKAMRRLCKALRVDYDDDFLGRWPDNPRVTGDTSGSSRGSRLRRIEPLPQRALDPALLQRFRDNRDYREAIELLGYRDPPTTT
ncbi:MAG TPA: hypothetical protein ENK05_10235 [Gammaproteobacteria bacterium]|nr:hypothetical protein [Gammaproteobacteria bacterium]